VGNSISSSRVQEVADIPSIDSIITLIDSVAASLNNPIDISVSPDGQYLYAISVGRTGSCQPPIYINYVSNSCGLSEIQVISDDLPSEFITIFGVFGFAVF